ncbi:hypothetical protein [Erythrobacter sp.]|uniref:hypothetical protein n=1 Tax=Erythrobacter sp. TaxID=1042 RepID=UPI002EC2BD34|nr:hypothetical protein [Erythrobacter sp.]
MTRLAVLLLGYIASAVVGMIVLLLADWVRTGSAPAGANLPPLPVLFGGALVGVVLSLPAALPAIVWSEHRRRGPAWLFAAAGLATAILLILLLSDYGWTTVAAGEPRIVRDIVVAGAACISASLTFWLVAWRLFPPHGRQEPKQSNS